jgi:hypothetical protein
MKITLIILEISFSMVLQAQTKKIAHKSHSGSEANFIAANYLDNLGDPPMMFVDKIVRITDTIALQYCSRFKGSYSRQDTIKYQDDFYETDSVKLLSDTVAVKFSSGYFNKVQKTDTIISDKNKLRYLILREETYNPYVNKNYKEVEFVGFEDSTKKETIPVNNNFNSPQNREEDYNKGALKHFLFVGIALIVWLILSLTLFLRNKVYA